MSALGYALGLDFGTASCRALIVRLADGGEVGEAEFAYPSGTNGVLSRPTDPLVARQHPRDYVRGMETVIVQALAAAADADAAFAPDAVVGIGVATTGSTPMPVDADGQPLGLRPEYADNLEALAWLWKDHTAHEEAERITERARELRPEYVRGCGGVYSAEWFWAKVWHCRRVAPDVFSAAYTWVELCDLLPALLIGVTSADAIPRSLCAAGHKAMFSPAWGGLPDEEFLAALDPMLAALRPRLYDAALEAGACAGTLGAEWAARTGLREGTPVAAAAFDAHAAALGTGVREGVLVKVMGTSTCDLTVQALDHAVEDLPGVCGIVPGSVLPGLVGIEAGQSGVGDMFRWFADHFAASYGPTTAARYASLADRTAGLIPGEHGLVALDWMNGNRSILVDHRLSGLVVGLTLNTEPHHVYQALVEASAFGALRIVERLEEYGVPISEVVASGGLPGHNPQLMQTYADVVGRPIRVAATAQGSALGAALLGALAAGPERGGFATPAEGQARVVRYDAREYHPRPASREPYQRLYDVYRRLHDALGLADGHASVAPVMRELFDLRTSARAA